MDDHLNIQDKVDDIDDVDCLGLPVIHHTKLDFYRWLRDLGLRETRNIMFPGLVRLR